MDNENTTPAEEKDKKPEAEKPAEKAEEKAKEPKAETAPETPSGATEEQAEETTPETTEEAAESKPEQPEETQEESADPAAELEALRAENTRLKAQLEAHNTGFKPEYIEDAVLIAENAVSRDGITITEALQAVAKKYPEWKHTAGDTGKTGFKVGAEAPREDTAAEDASLDEAFGIRRKK